MTLCKCILIFSHYSLSLSRNYFEANIQDELMYSTKYLGISWQLLNMFLKNNVNVENIITDSRFPKWPIINWGKYLFQKFFHSSNISGNVAFFLRSFCYSESSIDVTGFLITYCCIFSHTVINLKNSLSTLLRLLFFPSKDTNWWKAYGICLMNEAFM